MKTLNFLAATVVATALLGSTAALADADNDMDHSHPTAFVRDSVITTKVKARLAANDLTSLAKIHVDTDRDGVVWLSGTARSHEVVEKAIEIARTTDNVRDVHNDIRIRDAQ